MRTRGVTTVELSLVAVITTILCGVAAPRITVGVAIARVRGAERALTSAITCARQLSMARNETLRLRAQSGIVTLTGPEGLTVRDFDLPSGLSVCSEPSEMVFSPRGTCTPARITASAGATGVELRVNVIGLIEPRYGDGSGKGVKV